MFQGYGDEFAAITTTTTTTTIKNTTSTATSTATIDSTAIGRIMRRLAVVTRATSDAPMLALVALPAPSCGGFWWVMRRPAGVDGRTAAMRDYRRGRLAGDSTVGAHALGFPRLQER